jgi:NAD(P)-dependent dehydrogenase (short-subunit alcohol dehydrogenase family)
MSTDPIVPSPAGRVPVEWGLSGRTAVVTGGGSGIGRRYGQALAAQGVSVAVLDIDESAAVATAAELGASGVPSLGLRADVTDEASMIRAADQVAAELGGIDILINNAGLHLPEWSTAPTALSGDRWRRLLEVNVVGIVNGVRAARRHLRASGHGVVLNQGSVAGHRPLTSYGVSKLAVRGLTVALANELAGDLIRVVSIAPGAVRTPSVLGGVPSERLDALVGQQLIARLSEMDDLVGPMLFLCSDLAGFVTGETLVVSGGYPLQV